MSKDTRERLLDSALKEVYTYGYQGSSTAKILENAKVPKGSMYHYFKSKKELVLALIDEKIAAGLLVYFEPLSDKNLREGKTLQTIITITKMISKNEDLVMYGCPLNKLIQEMAPIDEDFASILTSKYNEIFKILENAISFAVKTKEIKECDPQKVARFIFQSIWGYLSISVTLSSKERFLEVIEHLESYFESLRR